MSEWEAFCLPVMLKTNLNCTLHSQRVPTVFVSKIGLSLPQVPCFSSVGIFISCRGLELGNTGSLGVTRPSRFFVPHDV
jgi:hypothetical protein